MNYTMNYEKNQEKKYVVLTNEDLIKNRFKYDIETIEWNLRKMNIGLRPLVANQKLTPYVCAKYVVFGGRNERYADCTEDAWIGTYDILRYQPHITHEEMGDAHSIADEEDEQEDAEEDERKQMKKEDVWIS